MFSGGGDVKLVLMLVGAATLCATVPVSGLDAQVARSPDRPRTPPPPVYSPMPATMGRAPNIGRLPLLEPMQRLGTECIEWNDRNSMQRMGIARGWHVFGAFNRRAFVGVFPNGRIRYVSDAMQDQPGPYADREEITVHFLSDGNVELGRRGAWNIGHDAAVSPVQVTNLLADDGSRAYLFARSLLGLCANARR
jgi:hypothetical protein